jgi:hypothetical protein
MDDLSERASIAVMHLSGRGETESAKTMADCRNEVQRLRAVIDAMQGHTFFCQDAEGFLRRWYPPNPE